MREALFKTKTYYVTVQTVLVDSYEIEATDPDQAHKAAAKRANDHLRDDGQMLEVSTTIEGAQVFTKPIWPN